MPPNAHQQGNRMEITVPTLGKVQIEFPLYAAHKCPIQFHLPVVCDHHLQKKIAPNCHIIRPDPIYASEVEYRGAVGQQVRRKH